MNTRSRSKHRISITIMPDLNDLLETAAKEHNMSKSSLIEEAVEDYIYEKLDSDTKALSRIHFEDIPSDSEWLSIMPKIKDKYS